MSRWCVSRLPLPFPHLARRWWRTGNGVCNHKAIYALSKVKTVALEKHTLDSVQVYRTI